jgi:hypothetical protein
MMPQMFLESQTATVQSHQRVDNIQVNLLDTPQVAKECKGERPTSGSSAQHRSKKKDGTRKRKEKRKRVHQDNQIILSDDLQSDMSPQTVSESPNTKNYLGTKNVEPEISRGVNGIYADKIARIPSTMGLVGAMREEAMLNRHVLQGTDKNYPLTASDPNIVKPQSSRSPKTRVRTRESKQQKIKRLQRVKIDG